MNFLKRIGIILCISNSLLTEAQTPEKLNMLFQQGNISSDVVGATYQPVLYELTLNKLVHLNKFNIITRTPAMWRTIENELALGDFIDPKTAVRLGDMLGAHYLLEGNVSQFSCERKLKPTTDDTIEYHHSCVIHASLKINNLATGQYEESVNSISTINDDDREKAIQRAIQEIATDLVKTLSKKFLVQANIKKITPPDNLVIDKGYLDGVRQLGSYTVLSFDKSTNKKTEIAIIRITATSNHEASARLLTGDLKSLTTENSVIESTTDGVNVVAIEKKEKSKVYINAGKDLGLKPGDVFVAMEKKETTIGERVVVEKTVKGKVYIKEVKEDYAIGKIISGYNDIQTGTSIVEATGDDWLKFGYLRFRYKSSLGLSVKPNSDQSNVTVVNGSGNFEVLPTYLADLQPINSVDIISLGIGSKNLVKDLSTSLYFDIYKMGSLKNWICNIDVAYEYPVIPEKIHLSFGGAFGYGRLMQDIPNHSVAIISNGKSSQLKSHSIFLSGNAGINYKVSRFIVGAALSYDYLVFKNWKYEVEVDTETKTEFAPNQIVPYPKVNLSGLYYDVSLAYIFKR
jgi:hypothetical protein